MPDNQHCRICGHTVAAPPRCQHSRTARRHDSSYTLSGYGNSRYVVRMCCSVLFPQAVHVFDSVVRRLSVRFAELIDWPSSTLADVVTARQKVGRKYDYVVLNLCSRNLKGNVVFRVLNVTRVTANMPSSAMYALDETNDYWQRVVYL